MEANLKIGPKVGYFNVVLASFAHFCGDFYCNILPVLLPIFALKYGFSYSQCGLLYMIFQVTASFLQAPIGLYADKKKEAIINIANDYKDIIPHRLYQALLNYKVKIDVDKNYVA